MAKLKIGEIILRHKAGLFSEVEWNLILSTKSNIEAFKTKKTDRYASMSMATFQMTMDFGRLLKQQLDPKFVIEMYCRVSTRSALNLKW